MLKADIIEGHTSPQARISVSQFESLFGKNPDFGSRSIYVDERAGVACFDISEGNRGYRLTSRDVTGNEYLSSAQHLDSTFKDKGYITQFFHDDKKGLAGITFKKETQRAFV